MSTRRMMMASATHVKDGVIQDSWEEIAEACNKGLAEKYYSIGDTKELDLGEFGIVHMELTGFHCMLKSIGSSAPTAWISEETIDNGVFAPAGSWSSDIGDYTQIMTIMRNKLLPLFPPELANSLIPVENIRYQGVSTYDGYSRSHFGKFMVTSNEIWLPGLKDFVCGRFETLTSEASRIKCSALTGSPTQYFLRDSYCGDLQALDCTSGYVMSKTSINGFQGIGVTGQFQQVKSCTIQGSPQPICFGFCL